MFWICLAAVVGATIVVAYVIWRKWIAPWPEIEKLVRQVGRGEQPRTFLVDGGRDAERVGAALEGILTRQRTLDRQLADYRSGQEAVFSAMQDGLLVINRERRIALLNRTFAHWFGVPDNSLGASLIETVRDPAIERLVNLTFEKREAVQCEITTGDRQLQMNSVPLGVDRRGMTGAVILFHDITELKRLDDLRRDLVANVSHELRTPLSILRGYIETLLNDEKSPNGETAKILRVMEKHSNRLHALIEDLLTLAKLESISPELRAEKIDLRSFLTRLIREWNKKFRDKNLNIGLEFSADLPPIFADEFRLEQLVANLFDNALKYSRDGGEVRVRVAEREKEIALSVSDNGIGISKEDLPRIFERFYRADKSRSAEKSGTGLGLAIVKHIAQLHGGRVEAESEPGKGTTVRVMLPGDTV